MIQPASKAIAGLEAGDQYPAPVTTADAIVETLIRQGVDTVYALPGLQSDPLFDAFYRAGDRLRVIHPRHEQAAAYMALGAALVTGRPQVCAVVPGPGFLNASAALLTAYSMNAPVIALVGQIPQADIDRGHGHLHELHDQLGIARHFSKQATRIRTPQEAPGIVDEAIRSASSGRQGPVVLECSMDVLAQQARIDLDIPPYVERAVSIDVEAVDRAARILAEAERPLIIVGGGAQDAGAQVAALAEMLEAPVSGYRRGTGVIPSDHRLNVRLPVAHRLWAEADVVLAIGTRLHTQQSMWGVSDDLKIIRVDINPEEPDRFRKATVALVGDASAYARALLEMLPAFNRQRLHRDGELSMHNNWLADKLRALEPQMSFLKALRAALPKEGIFVDEVTQVGFVSRLAFPVFAPRSFLSPGYQDNLGWGIGTALGVKAAMPDRPVLAISGDGGFLYQVGELATAVKHNLNVVFVVFDNAMYGNVKRIQQERYGNRVIAADLASPDFVKLAESFGAMGLRARTAEELEEAVKAGFASGRPTLVHVPCGEMPSPWPLILMPKVR
ncbi:thiamine pyrophosphate-dependent enzyme [Phyllobacterium sophorae]|uniref:TPP-binding protein n=1 Tax=Phyllobacterium sophorae TaxID=1520277 RepID=A0A2P7B6M0_9HYPH|nr:thiamine pyrophosphate-dependent enzyme [Phyllobacterium sophorae]PSH62111.1 TPP-binding protein [Phyllobacterium sophorae]